VKRSERAILGALTLAALALRLRGLGDESVWVDEGWSMRMIGLPPGEFFRATRLEDGHPPLYLLLLRGWSALFPSIEGLRAMSALCMAASVPFFWLLARRLLGEAAAWTAAALAAGSPVLVAFGQEMRSYALVVLLASISCAAWTGSRRRDRVVYVLATAALLWTHYMTVWLVAAQALTGRRGWLGAQAAAAALFAPWAPFAWEHVTRVTADFWIEPPTAGTVLRSFQTLCFYLDEWTWMWWRLRWGLTALWAAAALFGMAAAWRRGRKGAILLWLLLIVPPAGELLLSAVRPLYYTRTFLYVTLALYALAGAAVEALRSRKARWALASVLVGSGLIGIVYQWTTPEKEDWRGAAALIGRGRAPGDAVLVYPWYGRFALEAYGLEATGVGEERIGRARPRVTEPAVPEAPRAWVVLRYGASDKEGALEAALERGGYRRASTASLLGVEVHRYDRPAR
jgi:hypothetical protein